APPGPRDPAHLLRLGTKHLVRTSPPAGPAHRPRPGIHHPRIHRRLSHLDPAGGTRRRCGRFSVGGSPDSLEAIEPPRWQGNRRSGEVQMMDAMRLARWRPRAAVAVGVAALMLAQPVTARAAEPAVPPVAWGACAADVLAQVPADDHGSYTCATYQVPLDYAHPSAG